jgi:FKBP-type peptidyl-prolyl cis-trans isomerase SlyD
VADQTITAGKHVSFAYQITGPTGAIIERVDVPVSYVHGSPNGLHGKVEAALAGRVAGDTVAVEMTPEDSFGPVLDELIHVEDLRNVPEEFHRFGAEVEFQSDRGDKKTFRVTRIGDGKVTLDGNHPLAGLHLRFTIEVRELRDATAEEIEQAEKGPEQS